LHNRMGMINITNCGVAIRRIEFESETFMKKKKAKTKVCGRGQCLSIALILCFNVISAFFLL
jgi:hypothetical protein